MPVSPRPFAQVDVFAEEPYLGNPVAVVVDATGLSEVEMQRLAKWTNLSETTFILPPTSTAADYRVRIFTPNSELPFAGHPTIGTAHAWLEHGGVPKTKNQLIQECQAGLIKVNLQNGADGKKLFEFQAPPTIRTGPLDEELLAKLTKGLGIPLDKVVAHQWVDNGPGWTVIQVPTAEDVLALNPDLSLIPDAMVGVIGAYRSGADYDFEIRAFAPGVGVVEDPVTGSLNASVAQWLVRAGVVTGRFKVSQGSKVGRLGSVSVGIDEQMNVWVGGRANTLIEGEILI